MEMIIQVAEVSDARDILALQKQAYQSEAALYDDYVMPPLTETLEELEDRLREILVLKAVEDGKIVGSARATVQDGTCLIGRLIVAPECQNRGIGTRLMQEIESRCGTVRRYELFTGHRSARSLHLYHKLGYHVCRTQPVTTKLTLVYLEKVRDETGAAGPSQSLSV
jgi:ribosomal protein S18 acetylase RimI-like enzyme